MNKINMCNTNEQKIFTCNGNFNINVYARVDINECTPTSNG